MHSRAARVILDTSHLFLRLLRTLDVDVVCDVGSLNGADALRFRTVRPDAAIFAFEANPVNERRMRASAALARACVEVVALAICERDGDADFFVVDATNAPLARQGMSSLYLRAPAEHRGAAVRVACARLDGYLGPRLAADARIALWLDVEGKAFEALSGADSILERVAVIHVELESEPCIGTNQKLAPEVHALLSARGFRLLGADHALSATQFNAVYVSERIAAPCAAAVEFARRAAALRHAARRAAMRVLPGRVREFIRRRRAVPAHVSTDA
jgi:FkbM family methyltransferase